MGKHSIDKRTASPQDAVLLGVLVGVLLSFALLAGIELYLPAQDAADANKNYGYVYSDSRSASVAFSTAAADENSMLLFGSSELSTSSELVPQFPSKVFGTNAYGLDLICVGGAYNQNLWQAVAAGAYAQHVPSKKVALIVSPTWFEDAGMDEETFKLKFSYSLYRAFCANDTISDELKQRVAQRLADYNVDSMSIAAGQKATPVDAINDAVLGALDDLKLRNSLGEVRSKGIDRVNSGSSEPETPDFEALEVQAYLDAADACTNNDWGMDDSFYKSNLAGRLDQLAGTQSDETFSNEAEFEDFSLFLDVCEQTGLEPLIIISPLHGALYDHLGTKAEDRARCYERVADICIAHGVDYVDFSNREYEEYFLHDIVHLGWVGWAEVDEALYKHFKG